MLISVTEPQPQQVRAVPSGHYRLKITFKLFIGIGFGEHCIAVGERHGAALRIAGSELDRYGSAGVTPIGGDMFDAERGERFVERVGEFLDARFQDRQLVGQTEPGRVEGKTSEALAENRQ